MNRSFNWWNEVWVCRGAPIYCKRKFPIVEEQQLLNAGRTIQRENLFHICSRKLSNTINCTWKSALLEVFPALQQKEPCQFFVNKKKWRRGPKMMSNNARSLLTNPNLMLSSKVLTLGHPSNLWLSFPPFYGGPPAWGIISSIVLTCRPDIDRTLTIMNCIKKCRVDLI